MGHVLQVTDLAYAFPGFDFGPVSLTLQPGRICGVLGPNGAGKSTLLNLLTQQLRPAGGRVAFGGHVVDWNDPAWKTRFSFIRETPAFYDELRVREVLAFTGRIYGQWDAGLADRLGARLELDMDKRVGHLSKGNLVKLGLVSGISSRAELLVLDEPTAGLDPSVRAGIQQTLRELLAEQGPNPSVVLSSHIFDDLEEVADDLLILRNGRIIFESARSELDRMALYRCPAGNGLDLAEARLRWRTRDACWALARRDGALAATLAERPDCVEEQPRSIIQAAYHGAQQS